VAIVYREMRRLEDELKKLEDAQRVWNNECREIESLIREIKGFKDQLQNIRQSIEDSLNKISKAFNMNVDSIDKVSNIKNSKREEMDRLIKELKGLESRKSLYQVYIERFEVSKACSLCGASIKDPDEFKKYIADGISKIDVEIKRISNEVNKLSLEISQLEGFENQLNMLYSMYQSLARYIQSREAKLVEASNRVLDVCRNYSSNINSINDCLVLLKKLSEQYEHLKLQLDYYKQVYGSLTPPAEDADTIIARLKDVERFGVQVPAKLDLGSARQLIESLETVRNSPDRRLRELNSVYATKKGELEEKKAQLKNIEDELRERNEEVKQIEEQLKKLTKAIDAYETIETFAEKYLGKGGVLTKELTKFVRAELERRTNTVLARLELREIAINKDYDIFIKIEDGLMPLSNASGGKRVAIAIAMRLALAELVMGKAPTVLILDEPTVYLDDERRIEVFNILGELGRNLKQVIIVTHDEKVIDISDTVIRVENIGNIGRISRER
jgi:exonuclease SbcC